LFNVQKQPTGRQEVFCICQEDKIRQIILKNTFHCWLFQNFSPPKICQIAWIRGMQINFYVQNTSNICLVKA